MKYTISGIAETIAKFIANTGCTDIPPAVIKKSVINITDGIAVMAGGMGIAGGTIKGFLTELGGRSVSTVIGTGIKTSAPLAALANGIFSHLLDYDDISESMGGHPTGVVLAAVLAVGEMKKADGKRLLTSYAVGVETETKLGSAVIGDLYTSGWHPTSVLGIFGAVAGCCNLLGLDEKKTVMALSMAASLACGLKKNFGTTTKSLHVGNAAKSGVICAMMAERGLSADPAAMDGSLGLFDLLCGKKEVSLQELKDRLGNPWEIEDPGIHLKKYPCCGSIHPAIDALLKIQDMPRPERIRKIECRLNDTKRHVMKKGIPKTGLEARFSAKYCIAAAALEGACSLSQFTVDSLNDPALLDLLPKISVLGDSRIPEWGARVEVEDVGGKRFYSTCKRLSGIKESDHLSEKLHDCADPLFGPEKTEMIREELLSLPDADSINRLMELLASADSM